MATPAEGLARLHTAAESGELDTLCNRHRIRILTVFGSAGRGESNARDLDVAVMTEPGATFDSVQAINDLIDLTHSDDIDLAHLNRAGPVLRERALVGSVALFESTPGALAAAATAAIALRIETDPMRRLDLELLAG
ncbi:MAG: nucleotidyltransferase family protein [Pseudonocardiaceae bacterium]